MESALWAGRRRQGEPARIRLSATLRDDGTDQDFIYAVDVMPGSSGIPSSSRPG
ncbi:hypothetical protein [Methylobacterium sp. NEAU K]|uniref:hypothetical protein n=1 Tax=Methylobacterium sp. NEAU K TaxID=3064946 RepID=UPI00351DDC1B